MTGIRKKIANVILKPWTENYLKKDRPALFFGSRLYVKAGVFHPRLFYSTVTFWKYIRRQEIKGLRMLEIGTGSGALAISSAKAGANVSACDIHPDAVETTRQNATDNVVSIQLYISDLFDAVPPEPFDRILVNPPFYPKQPSEMKEYAWYCGPEFEFFDRFFADAGAYLAPEGEIWMVLSDECNIAVIREKATFYGYACHEVYSRRVWLEKNIVYCFKQ